MTVPIKSSCIRYTNISLPDYRYIPKLNKYHGKLEELAHVLNPKPQMVEFSEQTWQNSIIYLYAIDLFNYGYYWEVHEVLEILWLEKGKNSPIGIFLQGIIQLSIGLLKKQQLNKDGLKLLTDKALSKLNFKSGFYIGIDIEKFVAQFNAFVNDESNNPPFISLNFNTD